MATNDRRFLQAGGVENECFRAGFLEGYQQALKATLPKSKLTNREFNAAKQARTALNEYVKYVKQNEEDGRVAHPFPFFS